MATETRAAVQGIQHDNYNASTEGATKTPTVPFNSFLIHNLDATNNVLVSFDGGANWKTVLPQNELTLQVCRMVSYQVKSSGGTPAVEALYGYEK